MPAETRFTVDVRVVEPGEKERIEAAMAGLRTGIDGAVIEVSGGIGRPPMHESASASLFPLAVDAAAQLGQPVLAGVAVGGGSDGNFTAAIGVPTLDGLGAVGGGAHADHEHVLVDTMVAAHRPARRPDRRHPPPLTLPPAWARFASSGVGLRAHPPQRAPPLSRVVGARRRCRRGP